MMSLSSVTTLVPAGGLLPAGPAGAAPWSLPGAPALAAGVSGGAPPVDTVLRLLLLTALTVVAGTGLVRVLAGPAGRPERVVAGAAALVAVAAAVAAVTWSGAGTPVWTLGMLAATVAVPGLLWTSRQVWAAVPAVVVTALLVRQLAAGEPGTAVHLIDAGYAVAGALLAGAAVHLAATRTGPAPGRVRALALTAGAAATALAGSRIVVAGPFAVAELPGTGYGRAAALTVAAPAAVVLLVLAGTAVSRRTGPSARERVRAAAVGERTRGLAAVAAVVGAGAATLLAALPAPAPAAVPGQALLRGLDLGSGPLTLTVAPMRPGPNLVQLTGGAGAAGPAAMPGHGGADLPDGYRVQVAGRDVPLGPRTGAAGRWALVDLPAGTRSLTVAAGGISRSVPVDVGARGSAPDGSTGPDGPECLSAVLGRITAGGDPTVDDCPSQALEPADERALRATVRSLAAGGVPAITLAGDASPRSRAAAAAVRAEAAAVGLPVCDRPGPDDALVVVSGWQGGAATLRDTTVAAAQRPTALGGIHLAPWLLSGAVLANTTGVLLPLDFGPQEEVPQRYVRSVAAVAPGTAPSVAGLRAWAAERGVRIGEPPALYGAAPVSVPMTSGDEAHHQPNAAAWFPGGAVVRIGGPLDPPPAP